LVKKLRETFVTFGIPEDLTSDGGPQFTAGKTQEFLKTWGVRHRISSVAKPHAKCRAELAVKTVKRILTENTSATGSLDVDKFQRALLIYRNSIEPETKSSPPMILFGPPIRDAIPIVMGRYSPHQYVIRVDGTGRITLRNRQHLKKFTPFQGAQKETIYVAPLPVTERPKGAPQNTSYVQATSITGDTAFSHITTTMYTEVYPNMCISFTALLEPTSTTQTGTYAKAP
jgi:hypothetical protein